MGGRGRNSSHMSLSSFFDTLDTEAQFDAWKATTIQKLRYLESIIPQNEIGYNKFIVQTITQIEESVLLSSDYMANAKYIHTKKEDILGKLKECNALYKKFGK